MSKKLEFTDAFLRLAHPANQGWEMRRNEKLGSDTLDFIFDREGCQVLIVIHKRNPIVHQKDLKQAMEIQQNYVQQHNCEQVKVLLVYGQLLSAPPKMPTGVSVVSVMEEEDHEKNDLLHVCTN